MILNADDCVEPIAEAIKAFPDAKQKDNENEYRLQD